MTDAPLRKSFIARDGTPISYLTEGTGPPVLLLHGFVSSAIGWWMNGVATRLAVTHRVLAPDFRGHGESGKPSDPAAYGTSLVSDLCALLDVEGEAAADVAGFSMGAEVGLALAAWHPDRVRSVTLTGSGWSPPEIMAEYRKWFGILVEPENGRPPHPNAAALAAVIEGMPSLVGLPGESVASLRMPVRGIIGALDDERPWMERIATVRPGFVPYVLDGADHLGTWRSPDFPDLVARAVNGRL